MACYDLSHQIRCAKYTFSGRSDITPMVCCSFGGHSTPQFLQCMLLVDTYIKVDRMCSFFITLKINVGTITKLLNVFYIF